MVVLSFLASTGAGVFGWSLAGASALLTWAALFVRRRSASGSRPSLPWWENAEWVYLALLSFLVLVLVPLPFKLTTITGVERFAQNSVAVTRLRQADALNIIELPTLLFSVTRNRAGTLRVLAICMGAFSAALLVRRMPRPGRLFLLRALILGGTLVAGAGIVSLHIIPQGHALWWTIDLSSGLGPSSAACFVNQNHFGGFAAMLCPAAVIAAAVDISKRRWPSALLMCVCAIILAAAVPLSESRGGVVAGASALVILPLFLLTTRHRRVGLWMLIPLLALVVTLSLTVLPRVEKSMRSILSPTQTASLQGRMQVWRESLTIWRHYPILGAGPNSFHAVYPMHRASSVSGHRTHAENLYAETIADSGTVGTLIALWAVMAALSGFYRAHSSHEADPMLTFAACGAVVVAGVHALVDFATYIPLYSFTLGALVGLALPASVEPRKPAPALIVAAGLTLVVCFVSPIMDKRDSVYAIPGMKTNRLAKAIVWAPTSQHAWFYAGRRMIRSKEKPVKLLGERFMTQSMVYDPKNYRHWRKLGELRWKLKDREGARKAYEEAHALRSWVGVPAYLKEDG
jgi:O-antigen ligase